MDREDEQLRKESPAYQPGDGWERVLPRALDVVLSVRLDAASARRLSGVAKGTGRTPSRLMRDWVLERLDSANKPPASVSRVGERRTAYVVPSGDAYEELRVRYRPRAVRLLLIGESRPAGGTFFYLANSHLFRATHEAFERALGALPAEEAFLTWLRTNGVWLYDVSPAQVNRLRGRPRQEAVDAHAAQLVEVLRDTKPEVAVVIKRTLAPLVRQAVQSAGLQSEVLQVLPFPLYQWRAEYLTGLSTTVRRLFRKPGGKRARR